MKTSRISCHVLVFGASALFTGLARGDIAPAFPGITSGRTSAPVNPVARIPETSSKRLDALRQNLQFALKNLQQAPADAPGGFVEKAIAGVNDTLALVDQGTAYVKGHPEVEALPDASMVIAVPYVYPPSGMGILTQARVKDAYPTMADAVNALQNGLVAFVDGAPDPSVRHPLFSNPGAGVVIGSVGGYRDKIVQSLGSTVHNLMQNLNNIASNRPVVEIPASDTPAKPGSISGVVVDSDGDPAANVLIGFTPRAEIRARAVASYTLPAGPVATGGFQANVARMTPERRQAAIDSQSKINANSTYPAGVPTTITNDKGEFTITNLPPDVYIVTGGLIGTRGGWTMSGSIQPIEVKEGAETKLSKPLHLDGNF